MRCSSKNIQKLGQKMPFVFRAETVVVVSDVNY